MTHRSNTRNARRLLGGCGRVEQVCPRGRCDFERSAGRLAVVQELHLGAHEGLPVPVLRRDVDVYPQLSEAFAQDNVQGRRMGSSIGLAEGRGIIIEAVPCEVDCIASSSPTVLFLWCHCRGIVLDISPRTVVQRHLVEAELGIWGPQREAETADEALLIG